MSTQEAAAQLRVTPGAVRQWAHRGHITPVLTTQVGRHRMNWYKTVDVWACAKARLTPRQLRAVDAAWAAVDAELARDADRAEIAKLQANRHDVI